MSKVKALLASAMLAGLSASSAFAAGTGPDYTAISAGINWTTTIAAIMGIAAGAVVLLLAIVGVKKVFAFIKAV
ncbi:hypothetical protein ABN789_001206 [Salmonella enterica]